MSSSAHSALASLTANYTDSEPEEEEEDVAEQEDEVSGKTDTLLAATASISPDADEESNSREEAQSVSSAGDSGSGSRTKGNPLGLVSYQDDIVDDDMDNIDPDSDSTRDKDQGTDDDVIIHHHQGSAVVVGDSSKDDKPGVTDLEDISQDKDLSGETTEKKRSTKKTVQLPPEPPGKCSDELQKRFAHLYERKLKDARFNMNTVIQRKKQFRNPSIYEKLILQCDIVEHGTNYPKHIFDPFNWDESSYYDELAKAQKVEMERREKERKERTKVEFVSGTVKKTAPATSGSQVESEPKRKSKWDQKGVMPVFGTAAVSAPTIQPVLVQPPFTANTSGTKGTVINAFGSLPKKPKM